ncbi:Tetratricopeptide (TPR) repeat [Methanophagales archaeon]|nr:Tetratricopeptide (TPR) repeat [Methanophagales archaeon]
MGKRRELLIRLVLIVVVIGCLTHTSWGQENYPVNVSHPSPAKSDFSQEDILNQAQRSFDRSIDLFNTVATVMGLLVALITLIVAIGGILGYFKSRQLEKYTEQAKKSADQLKGYEDDAEKIVDKLEEFESKIDEINEKVLVVGEDKLPEIEEELDGLRETARDFPPLSEPFSEYQKRISNEYGKKIEFLEAFGVPLKPEDYLSRGSDFYRSKEYGEALKAYNKAIELKHDYDAAWNNRGLALAKLYQYDEALKAYDKAIELKHDYATAWYNKACAYSRKDDKENALKILSEAIDLDAKYKEKAKRDKAFINYWNDDDFKRVVS